MKKIILGSIVASSLLFGANSAEININNNTLEVGAEFSMNEIYEVNDDSNYYLTLNYLGSEEKLNVMAKSNQKLFSAGLKVVNPYIDDNGLTFGLGIKGVIADNYSKNFIAMPLGAYVQYAVTEEITVDGQVSYAPKVLTFSDGDTYSETKLQGNYKVIDNGYVYVGTRSIKTKYKSTVGTLSYDDSLFFGYRVNF